MRRPLLLLLTAALIGIAVELLLLGHTEDLLQWIPLALVAVALVALAWDHWAPSAASRRTSQTVMWLLILSGAAGIVLHFLGNREFQLETDPTLSGLPLVWKIIRAQSPPALAPATMALLGALGLMAASADVS
jgi:hypothetical protein